MASAEASSLKSERGSPQGIFLIQNNIMRVRIVGFYPFR
jgi:hypothetical protein